MTPFWLEGHGLKARFMPWGAVLMDLRLEGHDAPLVLGFEEAETYPQHSRYFGATAGRCANRIANGRFEIDGRPFQTDPNFQARHTLHGGREGIGKQLWHLVARDEASATFAITCADGHMGFPGNLELTARYSLQPNSTLRVEYRATTDAPTLCNLAHHSYWNLDGTQTLAQHRLQVQAEHYLPVDQGLIPIGTIAPVEGTAFDFRQMRPVLGGADIDHNLCLSAKRTALRNVARLQSVQSGVVMELATTEAGLQVYDGAALDVAVEGLGGRMYKRHAGLALEPQAWPDAINHPHFPSALLRPGETYEQMTEFRFSKEKPNEL